MTLRDAQVAVARAHGFEGWHAVVQNVGNARIEERDMHRWFRVDAVRLTALVADPLDREVLQGQLETEPWFGLAGA